MLWVLALFFFLAEIFGLIIVLYIYIYIIMLMYKNVGTPTKVKYWSEASVL